MNNTKLKQFTPGPWVVSGINVNAKISCHQRGFLPQVVSSYGLDHLPEEERQANARLISAAPDMLEALEHILSIIQAGDCPQIPDAAFTRGKIINAITKATGGQ